MRENRPFTETKPYGLTGTGVAVEVWAEREVQLPPEESSVVCVDQLEDALVDDVRLKQDKRVHYLFI